MGKIKTFILSRIAAKLANHQEGKITINGIEKLFPNGVAFRPPESRVVTIHSGNHVDHFFLSMSGYCFLQDLLPNKNWEHELDKWWIVEIPEDDKKVEEVIRFINQFKRDNEKISFTDDEKKEMKKDENFSPFDYMSDLEWEIWNKTGILFFQNWGGELRIGERDIDVTKYLGNGDIKRYKEKSPYLIASYYPYYFKVTDQEDKNYIPTVTENVIYAKVVNPYVAWVKSGDPFSTFKSIVEARSSEEIRKRAVHRVSHEIEKGTSTENPDTVLESIATGIWNELKKPENFFGFAFKDVDIVQVEITGKNAEAIKNSATSIYQAEKAQIEKTIKADTELIETQKKAEGTAFTVIKKAEAEAEKIKKEAEANAEKTIIEANALKEQLTIVEPEKIKQYGSMLEQIKKSGGNPELHQMKDIVGNLPQGGLNITQISDLVNNLTNQKTKNDGTEQKS